VRIKLLTSVAVEKEKRFPSTAVPAVQMDNGDDGATYRATFEKKIWLFAEPAVIA
jgi:hypothetical protein